MRVLFVGNSHTYFNDMPQTFAQLWQAAFGERAEVTMLAYSNRSLQWHAKEYFTLRFNLLYGGYDACVIQQVAHSFPGYEETRQGIGPILRLCRAAGTRAYLYIPWAEKRFPERLGEMSAALRRIAAEEGIAAVPIGETWQLVRQRRPDIELFWQDQQHASVAGDYLAAVVLCMTIGNRTDVALPDIAYDFTRGADIDFRCPRLIESAEEAAGRLEPDAAAAIRAAAAEILRQERDVMLARQQTGPSAPCYDDEHNRTKEDLIMRAFVDQNVCIGCGLCTGACPEVFDMNADGRAEAMADTTDANRDAVREAIENCPVAAIREEE